MIINSQNNPLFDFDDISIIPSPTTKISSRNNIPINWLPLISAPMNSVIQIKNEDRFNDDFSRKLGENILVSLPRGYEGNYNMFWFHSISLETFRLVKEDLIQFSSLITNKNKILVDIANGHLHELLELSKYFITHFPEKELMIGNIANPETYALLSEIGVHYVRCSIGTGDSCLTASNTAVNYPIASLIYECFQLKTTHGYTSKIVADGGFKSYSDIIKGLSLGADYVMLGSILNKALDSDSPVYAYKKIKITNFGLAKFLYNHGIPLYKRHVGMSTKEIQRIWNKDTLKTAEGKVKWNKVEYTLDGWLDNFNSYIKSTMSYMNIDNINDLKYNTNIVFITQNALKRFNR